MDALKLFDSDDHDIDYFYASRLPGEATGGVEDIHFHVFEPRQVRVYLSRNFQSGPGRDGVPPGPRAIRDRGLPAGVRQRR
ncbi:hypothetical protein DWB85_05470 [Seongchinamella sediminis]|uniref:Uncharacterized protein n=1 Tax=Seongchinamella sediminis TaxID=2283635 RepID=A0A3L7E1Y3_9GAMM|nr:hypothetical protein [Seongchinamella sediminis]RLQ22895.1 hypothetical protein DWB85_05470 [Seongchinamella sediminis]